MMQAGLTSTISKRLKCWDSKTIDATDVDDAGWVARSSCLLQQGGNKPRQIEDSVEVQSENPSPSRGRIFIVRSTPVRSGVVHKNMQLWLVN